MLSLRIMIPAIVAMAIALAPMGFAWMGVPWIAPEAVTAAHSHAGNNSSRSADDAMEDCASMMKGAAGMDDCPCCAKDKACQPGICLAKCFQLVGIKTQEEALLHIEAVQPRTSEHEHPPDWSDQPRPPPPRT